MNNFIVAVQNQLNFIKTLETWIAQLAVALPHPNGGGFLGQPAAPVRENVKAVITRLGKTMVEPKTKLKKISSTAPVHIPMLYVMQVLTYARYLKDILN
jgi:hypothetical protein